MRLSLLNIPMAGVVLGEGGRGLTGRGVTVLTARRRAQLLGPSLNRRRGASVPAAARYNGSLLSPHSRGSPLTLRVRPVFSFGRSRPTGPQLFPEVTGTTLDGVPLTFPADFHAEWNLLVLTFRDELDPLSDKWVRMAERIAEGASGRLAAYELPVVARQFRPFRAIVDANLGALAEDDRERARTVPLYVARDRFRKELGLKDPDTVHVLLVARDGRIAWRGEGVLTPGKVAELEEIVGQTLSALAADSSPPQQEAGRAEGQGTSDVGAAPNFDARAQGPPSPIVRLPDAEPFGSEEPPPPAPH